MPTDLPVFENSRVSVAAAWHGVMDFAIHNHLSYSALDELLKLLTFISPDPNHLPMSLHRLKRQYSSNNLNGTKFCSECLQVVPPTQNNCASRLCKEMKAEVCWFIHVPIENQIKILFEGEESVFCMSISLYTFFSFHRLLGCSSIPPQKIERHQLPSRHS